MVLSSKASRWNISFWNLDKFKLVENTHELISTKLQVYELGRFWYIYWGWCLGTSFFAALSWAHSVLAAHAIHNRQLGGCMIHINSGGASWQSCEVTNSCFGQSFTMHTPSTFLTRNCLAQFNVQGWPANTNHEIMLKTQGWLHFETPTQRQGSMLITCRHWDVSKVDCKLHFSTENGVA